MSSPFVKAILQRLFGGSFAENNRFGLLDLSNPTFVDSVFCDEEEYPSAKKAALVAHYEKHPVTVRRSFPRQEAEYPCVIIQRMNDSEAEGPMGDVFSETIENGVKTVCRGTRFAQTYELYIASANSGGPLQRDEIYEAIRNIFVTNRGYLESKGLINIKWSSGSDGEIEVPRAKRPLVIHTASIILDFLTEETTTEEIDLNVGAGTIQSTWLDPRTNEGDVTIEEYKQLKRGNRP